MNSNIFGKKISNKNVESMLRVFFHKQYSLEHLTSIESRLKEGIKSQIYKLLTFLILSCAVLKA